MTSAAVARAADAESLHLGSSTIQLLVDASATQGALSTHRVHLHAGAAGAGPHRHDHSSEMFYVLDGSVDLLAGDETLTATAGDLVVIPAGAPHAFAASAGHDGELLVLITPGVERFEFFRQYVRVTNGAAHETMDGAEGRYDTHPVTSKAWQLARAGKG